MEYMRPDLKSLNEKPTKLDWLQNMIDNVKIEIDGYIHAGFSVKNAMKRVKGESCAGIAVWKAIDKIYI